MVKKNKTDDEINVLRHHMVRNAEKQMKSRYSELIKEASSLFRDKFRESVKENGSSK